MLKFLNMPALLVILALAGFLSGGYTGYRLNDNIWVAKTEKLKNTAALELQRATEAVITSERKNAELATKIGVIHAKSQKEIRATLNENRRLVFAIGGLRDQGRRPSSCSTLRPAPSTPSGTAGTATGTDLSAEGGAILSPEVSEFILQLAYDADDAATYAKSCHEWIEELKK